MKVSCLNLVIYMFRKAGILRFLAYMEPCIRLVSKNVVVGSPFDSSFSQASEPELFIPGRYLDGSANENDVLKWTLSLSALRECPGISIARLQFNLFLSEFCLKLKNYSVDKTVDDVIWKTGRFAKEKYQLSL